MCLMVYIGSDKPLPLIDWNENERAFNVTELNKFEKSVESQFNVPHVYYVGSHLGCGCGFLKEYKVEEELAQTNNNYLQLNAYLQKARETGAQVQLYSCWDGDQSAKPEFRDQIELNHLLEASFEFKEKALYEVL